MCKTDHDRYRDEPMKRDRRIMPSGEGEIVARARWDENVGLVITPIKKEKKCAGETISDPRGVGSDTDNPLNTP